MCEKTSYAVKSRRNVLLSEFLFGESWNLDIIDFQLDLGIRQNIICQLLQWAISPKFSPSKILYRTVHNKCKL